MLLPERKEREYRFGLALRMVLPTFALIVSLIIYSFLSDNSSQNSVFYFGLILVLVFSIYFIFYLIYEGFETKITNSVSSVFTREYFYKYIKKELKKYDDYTLILVSVDNLEKINNRYGIKNGDKVLAETVKWIAEYFKEKGIMNFPIGHIKAGDFIIGLRGNKNEYKTILELMCLKCEDFKIDDIEIEISGAINDTTLSKEINYLVENLFELQIKNRYSKYIGNKDDEMDPSELESYVINAIKRRDLLIKTQDVFEKDSLVIKEYFIKLKTQDNKILHQKSYMKVLDKLRLMVDYDLIVLEKLVNRCSDLDGVKLAISISPTSIRNPQFLKAAREIFKKNPDAKNKIIFLLSENEYYPRIDKYNATLKEFKDIGIEIAIDRLGSIHTSFLYLRDLDIDIARFDSFYTKDMNRDKYKNIVDGFNVMAHKKGVKTWIKMVEDEDMNNLANELDIDYLQGKYLAPLDIEKL